MHTTASGWPSVPAHDSPLGDRAAPGCRAGEGRCRGGRSTAWIHLLTFLSRGVLRLWKRWFISNVSENKAPLRVGAGQMPWAAGRGTAHHPSRGGTPASGRGRGSAPRPVGRHGPERGRRASRRQPYDQHKANLKYRVT